MSQADFCGCGSNSKVLESRPHMAGEFLNDAPTFVRRRRGCRACGKIQTTFEVSEAFLRSEAQEQSERVRTLLEIPRI